MLDSNLIDEENNNNLIPDNKWRVKYYQLDTEGQWEDIGTGYVFIMKKVKNSNNLNIIVFLYSSND